MHRLIDRVELTNRNYRFTGKRFGYSPGSWIVGRIVAQRLSDHYSHTVPNSLPRLGYEVTYPVTDDSRCTITIQNDAGQYRVTFNRRISDFYPEGQLQELAYKIIRTVYPNE